MKKTKDIFCTLGPSSLNKKNLKFYNNKVSLLRLNMSHMEINKLKDTIIFIRKFSTVPICIDTEGAQIRTKIKKKQNYKKNSKLTIFKNKGNLKIYPPECFKKIKKKDVLSIGFGSLEAKVVKIDLRKITCKVLEGGSLENNKGVHVVNRNIKLNYITEKDKQAIDIAKKMNVRHFALSFTNSHKDMFKFNKLLEKQIKIYKIESRASITNLDKIISAGQKFIIDRGDLSKAVSVEIIPIIQRKILRLARIKKKKVYVATNFLESMVKNKYPTRGEANDIYNTLELGAAGLVLAAETAVGNYPRECVMFLRKMINIFEKYK